MPLSNRISSVDLLRGIVMIIMALDHTRDFFHIGAITGDPLDLATTTPQLFFTRWITHFCAPVFVFLSGMSAWFQGLRKPRPQLARFLLTRGLWLIVVEIVVMTLGITFDITYSLIVFQVIWAIAISMVALSLLIRLPFTVIVAIGILIVAGHNLLDYFERSQQMLPAWYRLLHVQSLIPLSEKRGIFVVYPFLPWIGVMSLGYCFGKYYLSDVMQRHRRAIVMGSLLVVIFLIVRFINLYGDPRPWTEQRNLLYSIFSFVNTQKYPPSLMYLCMTIGPALIVLGLIGDARGRMAGIISVYGRVPLFYYVVHFYVLHIIQVIFFLSAGHSFAEGMKGAPNVPFKFVMPGEGNGLGVVYLVWICVVIALYPLCKWFANYKAAHNKWWLSYL